MTTQLVPPQKTDEALAALPLLNRAYKECTWHRERYLDAVKSATDCLRREAARLQEGAIRPDNPLGLLQGRASDVDRLAATWGAARSTLAMVSYHFGVYLAVALDQYEIDGLGATEWTQESVTAAGK